MDKEIKSLILAAGKGTRMESDLPKVINKLNGKPMVSILLETLHNIKDIKENILILGFKKDKVIETLGSDISYVTQEKQLGTGDAVKSAKEKLKDFTGDVLILCGDCPLLSETTIKGLIKEHRNGKKVCTILTARLDNPSGYGRVVKQGSFVTKIVEELDADIDTKNIKEINSGVYLVDSKMLFEALDNIKNDNVKQEYYLTDIIEYFVSKSLKIGAYSTEDIVEIQGVNTKQQLQYLEHVMKSKI